MSACVCLMCVLTISHNDCQCHVSCFYGRATQAQARTQTYMRVDLATPANASGLQLHINFLFFFCFFFFWLLRSFKSGVLPLTSRYTLCSLALFLSPSPHRPVWALFVCYCMIFHFYFMTFYISTVNKRTHVYAQHQQQIFVYKYVCMFAQCE